jgi:hypothetical protein
MTRLTQVADRCAPADAVRVIEREWTDPRRVRIIVVGTIRIASVPTCVVESRLFGIQLFVCVPPSADGTRVPMIGIAIVGISLVSAKAREQFLVTPFVVAQGSPSIVVFGYTAEEDLRVVRFRR